jgi:hypothetical protein
MATAACRGGWVTHCLPIKEPHLGNILALRKDVEIRGTTCKQKNKRVALIRSGEGKLDKATKLTHGHVLAVATITHSEALTPQRYKELEPRHLAGSQNDRYKTPHGWFLADVHILAKPLAFTRKHGSVGFGCLSSETQLALAEAAAQAF